MISVKQHELLTSEWVHAHGERMLSVSGRPTTSFNTTKGFQCLPVCLYLEAHSFVMSAVKVCMSQQDIETACGSDDPRYKDWWSVPISQLTALPGIGDEVASQLKRGST
jgi:hypothetical protein